MPRSLGKVLLVQSNPRDVKHLKVNQEAREIRDALRHANRRIPLVAVGYVGLEDLVDLIQDERPDVLHFSGHGTSAGLVLEDENGNAVELTAQKLATIMKALTYVPRCVFLNACYADRQAQTLRKHIPIIVGTPPLPDNIAIRFASFFYKALARNSTIEAAFKLAKEQALQPNQQAVLLKGTKSMQTSAAGPEIYAHFETPRPTPDRKGVYEIQLGVRNLPDDVMEVVFNLDDDSYECEDRFFEVKPVGDTAEETIWSFGNLEVRAALWGTRENLAIRSTLVAALMAHYGPTPKPAIKAAITAIQGS